MRLSSRSTNRPARRRACRRADSGGEMRGEQLEKNLGCTGRGSTCGGRSEAQASDWGAVEAWRQGARGLGSWEASGHGGGERAGAPASWTAAGPAGGAAAALACPPCRQWQRAGGRHATLSPQHAHARRSSRQKHMLSSRPHPYLSDRLAAPLECRNVVCNFRRHALVCGPGRRKEKGGGVQTGTRK